MIDDTLKPLESLQALFRRDQREGRRRSLAEYLTLLPGHDLEVAEAYVALARGSLPDADATPAFSRRLPANGSGAGESIGPYRIVRELGRGGQGIVFLAEDTRLHRKVALKVLTNLGLVPEQLVNRFRREAEVASKLDHPGICGVYDAGTQDGIPYIAMRYVEGETLKDRIGRAAAHGEPSSILDLTEREEEPSAEPAATETSSGSTTPGRSAVMDLVALAEKVARALHAAHEQGVIHRDIKPANIMVTAEGDPVILDFGLARSLDEDLPVLTQSGDLFGTPAYMSLEQIAAQRIPVDRRTDVYSLGVCLYEALTLRRPFEAATREQLYQAILTTDPPDPRKLNPVIPPDLKVVLDTAMDKNRDRRYQTALHFAEDLRRVRRYEPILARPAGVGVRLQRWIQRNPALATSVMALFVLVIVASVLLSYGIGAARMAEVEAKARRMEEQEHERTRGERAALRQVELDRKLMDRLSELAVTLGMLSGPVRGHMDVGPVAASYLDAYRQYGLPLDDAEPPEDVAQRFATCCGRDESHARALLGGVYDLGALLEESGVARAAELKRGIVPGWATEDDFAEWRRLIDTEPVLVSLWDRIVQIIDAAEHEVWRRELWDAVRTSFALHEDRFDPFLDQRFIDARSAEELSFLAGMLALGRWQSRDLGPIIDRAIELRPEVFELHFLRGCLALTGLEELGPPTPTTDPRATEKGKELVRTARHHFQVAVALRPEAGIVHGLLGSALALDGQIAAAVRAVDRVTELEPELPLAWFMRGLFYARAYAYSRHEAHRATAIEAARKALALDDRLKSAFDLLVELGAESGSARDASR